MKLDEICTANNVIQFCEAHFCQIFTYFLSQEAEVIHNIFIMSAEMFTQARVLCGYAYRAGIGVAFTHHDATQYNQCTCTECEFFSAEQSHTDYITTCFQLAVSLQTNLTTQAVQNQSLLGFA